MRARPFLLVVLAGSSPIWSWGQTPKLQFEVASVRAVTTPVRIHAVSLNINHGRVTLDAAALRQIIGLAYGIQRVRVQGGGSWLDSDLFDIVASARTRMRTGTT